MSAVHEREYGGCVRAPAWPRRAMDLELRDRRGSTASIATGTLLADVRTKGAAGLCTSVSKERRAALRSRHVVGSSRGAAELRYMSPISIASHG